MPRTSAAVRASAENFPRAHVKPARPPSHRYHGRMRLHRPDSLLKSPRRSAVGTCQMRATLLLLAAASPALAQARKEFPAEPLLMRTAHAARRTGGPIQVDGRMDEPAWQAAPLEENFMQVSPDEGEPATVRTAFRVLWDDEYLYFGAVCDDPLPPTATLSRRDRFLEGDSVQFDLDTTLDRRTAYHSRSTPPASSSTRST